MTNGVSSRRRRTALSLSMPSASIDPIEQLDRIVEIFHHINRMLPAMVLEGEELIALVGLLAQVSGALVALTDQLGAPTNRHDSIKLNRASGATNGRPWPAAASHSLENCRDAIRAAYAAARALHANLRKLVNVVPWPSTPEAPGCTWPTPELPSRVSG